MLFPRLLMAENLRIGLIGLDSSHSEQFTLRLNDPANPSHIPGARVVAAFPGGSPDLPESAERVAGFTATLKDKYGVQILGSITEVCAAVDAVMILSMDGRPHLEQVREVILSKKPFFLDKPVAASLKEVVEIYRLAADAKVPMFSASSIRWYPGVVEVATAESTPAIAAISYGPSPRLPHHPDLFFYGIHPTEALFTVMGSGCQEVRCTASEAASIVTGKWQGDRLGTLHAIHAMPMGSTNYKLTRFGQNGVVEQKNQGDYTPMLREIVKFFQTSQPPVSAGQTLEIYAFMEAAQQSKAKDGKPVTLREVLAKAGAPEAWLPPEAVEPKS
ncbi:Gfo/Idh/MocA family oxidoreductase [Prosthecobacter sp. SYSU 5D2]|uniref:Gfo/Idh/MocA family protein n=1 Tax=Prosthecobacter sp. SYSU 5D2 TaxID=3134134 RepID=UPI0031FE9C21